MLVPIFVDGVYAGDTALPDDPADAPGEDLELADVDLSEAAAVEAVAVT